MVLYGNNIHNTSQQEQCLCVSLAVHLSWCSVVSDKPCALCAVCPLTLTPCRSRWKEKADFTCLPGYKTPIGFSLYLRLGKMAVCKASWVTDVKKLLLSSANCHLSLEQSPTAGSLVTTEIKALERRRADVSGTGNSSGAAEDDQKSLHKRIEI